MNCRNCGHLIKRWRYVGVWIHCKFTKSFICFQCKMVHLVWQRYIKSMDEDFIDNLITKIQQFFGRYKEPKICTNPQPTNNKEARG